jgi:hypothetical protein
MRAGSFLVLSEDSAKDADETIVALAKKLLLQIDAQTQTHRLHFEPANEAAKLSMRANLWKSRNPKDHAARITLRQAIATKLLERNVPGFVLFHFDGDRAWRERNSSENVQSFEDDIVLPVRRIILEHGRSAQQVDIALERLFRFVPFYSIESWTYQNAGIGEELCSQRCGKHAMRFRGWAGDRKQLDEVIAPKREICFGSAHNLELVRDGHPVAETLAARTSLAQVFEQLDASGPLKEVLHATYSTQGSAS